MSHAFTSNPEQLHALAYRFLATLFLQPPRQKWFIDLLQQGLLDEFPVPRHTWDIRSGLSLIQADFRRLAEGDDILAEAHLNDYHRLFLGPGHILAPPWESVYRSDEHVLFGHTTLEVREAYRQMGFVVANSEEPDDHIGLELLFVAILSEKSAAGDSASRHARDAFFGQHLLQWVPIFCADVAGHAATNLYRGLAKLTLGILETSDTSAAPAEASGKELNH
jgi:TorA maturation chaperone TorD